MCSNQGRRNVLNLSEAHRTSPSPTAKIRLSNFYWSVKQICLSTPLDLQKKRIKRDTTETSEIQFSFCSFLYHKLPGPSRRGQDSGGKGYTLCPPQADRFLGCSKIVRCWPKIVWSFSKKKFGFLEKNLEFLEKFWGFRKNLGVFQKVSRFLKRIAVFRKIWVRVLEKSLKIHW